VREDLVYVGTYTDPDRQASWKVSPERPFMGLKAKTGSQGIYLFGQNPATGKLTPRGCVTGLLNPSYLALSPRGLALFVTSEVRFTDGQPSGAVSAFALNGEVPRFQGSALNGGGNPSHVSVSHDGRFLLVASHEHGLVSVLPVDEHGSIGMPVDIRRDPPNDPAGARGSHAHYATVDPSGEWVLATNTGTNRISVYRFDTASGRLTPGEPAAVELRAGAGPRHLAFHPTLPVAYANGEHDGSVTVLRWDAAVGRLTPVECLSALPDSVPAAIVEANPFGRLKSAHLAMHPGGRLLLVSNRGYDSIAVYAVDPESGRLQRLGIHPTRGATPRAFGIDPRGTFVHIASQNADGIDCYRIDLESGDLSFTGLTTEVPAPACVVFGSGA